MIQTAGGAREAGSAWANLNSYQNTIFIYTYNVSNTIYFIIDTLLFQKKKNIYIYIHSIRNYFKLIISHSNRSNF